MRVLFLTSPVEDYLSDGLLHGLREILGSDVIDFPKAEILYESCPLNTRRQVRGGGFTLYQGLLQDLEIDRYDVFGKMRRGYFDLVVFSSIQRQFAWFWEHYDFLAPNKTALLDGEDTARLFPCAGKWLRLYRYWLMPNAPSTMAYYKREWTEDSRFSLLEYLLPTGIKQRLPFSTCLRKSAFSIPAGKIVPAPPEKIKDFPAQIVDKEVAGLFPDSRVEPPFSLEADYYRDLQQSRFGITTKRAGWDCLRHYEIAANGAVPCFRNLQDKPASCAPHGLNSDNCVVYKSANDLTHQLGRLSDQRYRELQSNAILWARANSTVNRAKALLDDFTSR